MTKKRFSKRLALATVAAVMVAATASGSALAGGHSTTVHTQHTPPGCGGGC